MWLNCKDKKSTIRNINLDLVHEIKILDTCIEFKYISGNFFIKTVNVNDYDEKIFESIKNEVLIHTGNILPCIVTFKEKDKNEENFDNSL